MHYDSQFRIQKISYDNGEELLVFSIIRFRDWLVNIPTSCAGDIFTYDFLAFANKCPTRTITGTNMIWTIFFDKFFNLFFLLSELFIKDRKF